MITVAELYRHLDSAIPASLSCEWDNDGLMCCPNPQRPVKKVLLTLDITEKVIEQAIQQNFDTVVSHHPLIFRPISALNPEKAIPRKLIKLVGNNITAMSFHTRLDALSGGVNDALALCLGVKNAVPFGNRNEEMGRIGDVEPCSLSDFAHHVKTALGAPFVLVAGNRPVKRVALLGGNGDAFVDAAKAAGADTYVSGRLGYHQMTDAAENDINLIEAGHFYTENIVLPRLAERIVQADGDIIVECTKSIEIFAL